MPSQGRIPFVQRIERTATAAETYVIQAPLLAAGQVLVLQAIAYTNEDTNSKDIVIGFRQGTTDVWLYTLAGGDKGNYACWGNQFTIRTEDRLIFKVLDPGLGDKTVINIVGYFPLSGYVPELQFPPGP